MAKVSLELAYSAIAVYTAAFVGYAVAAAATAGRKDEAKQRSKQLVGVGVAAGEASGAEVSAAESAEEVSGAQRATGPHDTSDAHEAVMPGRKAAGIATSLTVLAFLLQVGSVIARAISVQRVPWGNMHEFTLTCSMVLAGLFLVLALRDRSKQVLGVLVIPCVLLALGLSVTVLYADAAQLIPALRSGWLVVHVMSAMLATGGFALGALYSALYLMKERSDRRIASGESAGPGLLVRLLPDAASLDKIAYRVNAFTFPLWTFAVIAGAIWAENAWGRYWGWDPKETWAFITWVVYAAYLHARATAGWKARGSSWIALVGFGCMMFNYFGVNLFITGLHSYSGV
jgi:cytochrome c-type biogenesis protein CcsB